MTQLLTMIGDDRVKNTESAKMGRAGKLLECCCLVDKVVGEQHHVTGHGKGKGHEAKKEQRVQKEVSKTTATGWMWFLAIFIMMSSCQAASFAVEIQKTSVGFLLGTSLAFAGIGGAYTLKQWMNTAMLARCPRDVAARSCGARW